MLTQNHLTGKAWKGALFMKRTNTAKWLPKYNRWQIKVQKDGERRTFTSSTPGRTGQRECNAKADAWLDDCLDRSRERVESLFAEYVNDLKSRTSKSHWNGEEYRGRVWINPYKGMKRICNLNEQDLQDIINTAYSTGRLSKKSLCNIRATLSAFLKYCRKVHATTLRPEQMIIPAGARPADKKILQPADLTVLFTIDTTTYYGKRVFDPYIYAYRFSALTGLRPGELIGLRKSDIEGRNVKVQRAINVHGEQTYGKNENAIRGFVMTDVANDVLLQQFRKFDGLNVFPISSERHYRMAWKRYCEANGIPYIPPYNLRHTFVSMAKNLPEGEVKSLVGHSKDMDTFGIYGHEIEGEAEKAAQRLNAIFLDFLAG